MTPAATSTANPGPRNTLAAGALGRAVTRALGPRGLNDQRRLRRAVDGKIAVVTGASYGLGEATARLLAGAGATVVLGARSVDRLAAIAGEITATGGAAVALPLDLVSEESVAGFAAGVLDRFGRVDYQVHNAGKSLRRPVHLSYQRPKDLTSSTGVNYLGPMRLTLALLPAMRAAGSGHIVNVSTAGVILPAMPKWSFYLSSKAAFDFWMRCVATEARADGVTLTTFYAGLIHTRMSAPTPWLREMPGQTPEQAAQVVARAIVTKPNTLTPLYGHLAPPMTPLVRARVELLLGRLDRRISASRASRAGGVIGGDHPAPVVPAPRVH
jgi:NAD(P)-dependent dehydrogenase (short-subunit alcohol dehydrogenase family)